MTSPYREDGSPTYVVAVTRWSRPIQEEAQVLAPTLGMAAYDLRLRLSGPIPVIVAQSDDLEWARGLHSTLQARGHGAVACDTARIITTDQMHEVRSFQFGPQSLVISDPHYGQAEISYDGIRALIRAVHIVTDTVEETSQKRRFSASRAVLTGGLVPTKMKTKSRQVEEEERNQVLYVYPPYGVRPALLVENRLHYAGLGEHLQPTRPENYKKTIELIRQHVPNAFYDDRLVRSKQRGVVVGLGGSVSQGVLTSSNVGSTDLAAHLLVMAAHSNQL